MVTPDRRYGRFSILAELIQHNAQEIQLLMSRVVVLKADYRFDLDAIEYFAWSPDFGEILPYCEAPLYVAKFRRVLKGDDGYDTVFDGWS